MGENKNNQSYSIENLAKDIQILIDNDDFNEIDLRIKHNQTCSEVLKIIQEQLLQKLKCLGKTGKEKNDIYDYINDLKIYKRLIATKSLREEEIGTKDLENNIIKVAEKLLNYNKNNKNVEFSIIETLNEFSELGLFDVNTNYAIFSKIKEKILDYKENHLLSPEFLALEKETLLVCNNYIAINKEIKNYDEKKALKKNKKATKSEIKKIKNSKDKSKVERKKSIGALLRKQNAIKLLSKGFKQIKKIEKSRKYRKYRKKLDRINIKNKKQENYIERKNNPKKSFFDRFNSLKAFISKIFRHNTKINFSKIQLNKKIGDNIRNYTSNTIDLKEVKTTLDSCCNFISEMSEILNKKKEEEENGFLLGYTGITKSYLKDKTKYTKYISEIYADKKISDKAASASFMESQERAEILEKKDIFDRAKNFQDLLIEYSKKSNIKNTKDLNIEKILSFQYLKGNKDIFASVSKGEMKKSNSTVEKLAKNQQLLLEFLAINYNHLKKLKNFNHEIGSLIENTCISSLKYLLKYSILAKDFSILNSLENILATTDPKSCLYTIYKIAYENILSEKKIAAFNKKNTITNEDDYYKYNILSIERKILSERIENNENLNSFFTNKKTNKINKLLIILNNLDKFEFTVNIQRLFEDCIEALKENKKFNIEESVKNKIYLIECIKFVLNNKLLTEDFIKKNISSLKDLNIFSTEDLKLIIENEQENSNFLDKKDKTINFKTKLKHLVKDISEKNDALNLENDFDSTKNTFDENTNENLQQFCVVANNKAVSISNKFLSDRPNEQEIQNDIEELVDILLKNIERFDETNIKNIENILVLFDENSNFLEDTTVKSFISSLKLKIKTMKRKKQINQKTQQNQQIFGKETNSPTPKKLENGSIQQANSIAQPTPINNSIVQSTPINNSIEQSTLINNSIEQSTPINNSIVQSTLLFKNELIFQENLSPIPGNSEVKLLEADKTFTSIISGEKSKESLNKNLQTKFQLSTLLSISKDIANMENEYFHMKSLYKGFFKKMDRGRIEKVLENIKSRYLELVNLIEKTPDKQQSIITLSNNLIDLFESDEIKQIVTKNKKIFETMLKTFQKFKKTLQIYTECCDEEQINKMQNLDQDLGTKSTPSKILK